MLFARCFACCVDFCFRIVVRIACDSLCVSRVVSIIVIVSVPKLLLFFVEFAEGDFAQVPKSNTDVELMVLIEVL